MRIVIIEDEKITARDLAQTIEQLFPQAEIEKLVSTVKEGISYFTHTKQRTRTAFYLKALR